MPSSTRRSPSSTLSSRRRLAPSSKAMRSHWRVILVLVLALTGCLRPRYAEFVTRETTGKEVLLQLVESSTGAPVPNATVEMGEYRNKVSVKTDALGNFALPIEKKHLDDNSIIV